ncbi:MAG: thioredoxin [Peptoniphilaceae bacterium]|nr:thioredoxin [Peptoniphilaceae bacterium]MDY6018355.1 thioredoxin [Anaerococcus sp.]
MKELNKDEFKKSVLESQGIVLVDFSATWCGPCKMQAPVLEDLAKEVDYPIYSLDIDQEPEIAGKYNVNAVPSLMVFKDGSLKATMVGFQAKEVIEEKVSNIK